jgi:hypothetical protein
LLGELLLPATVDPTTGIPVEVRVWEEADPHFAAVEAGQERTIDGATFDALARSGDGCDRLLVRWPVSRVPAERRDALRGCVILDTPGYDALADGHEDLLEAALPEADSVLWIGSLRLGFTPRDRNWMERVAVLARRDSLFFALNWMPPGGGTGSRLSSVRAALRELLDADVLLHPLAAEAGAVGSWPGKRIWSVPLWEAITAQLAAPGRRGRQAATALGLAAEVVEILDGNWTERAAVHAQGTAGLDWVRGRIAALRAAQADADEALAQAQASAATGITDAVSQARGTLWSRCDTTIERASAWTDDDSTRRMLAEHIVPLALDDCAHRIEDELTRVVSDLAARLDTVSAQIEPLPGARAVLPRLNGDGVRGAGGGFLSQGLARRLARLGKLGARAAEALAAAIIELGTRLYEVARWKPRLRSGLQRLLELPVTDEPVEDAVWRAWFGEEKRLPFAQLSRHAESAAREALDATRAAAERAFGARAGVLDAELRRLTSDRAAAERQLEEDRLRIAACRTRLSAARASSAENQHHAVSNPGSQP